MTTAWELEIDGQFSTLCDHLDGCALLLLMDDYKALLMIASQHHDAKACRWLERRVDAITEAYGNRQYQPPLPF